MNRRYRYSDARVAVSHMRGRPGWLRIAITRDWKRREVELTRAEAAALLRELRAKLAEPVERRPDRPRSVAAGTGGRS